MRSVINYVIHCELKKIENNIPLNRSRNTLTLSNAKLWPTVVTNLSYVRPKLLTRFT